jgi:hypothetical protein
MPYKRGSDWQRQQSCEGLRKSVELEEKGKHFVFIEIVCWQHSYISLVNCACKLFKEATICLDTFSDQRGHGTFV